MEIYLAEQALHFAFSWLVGALIGAVYDLLRCSRIAFNLPSIFIAIEDILFFILAGFICFSYLLGTADGQLRYFLLLGQLMGCVLYFLILSPIFIFIATFIISIIKKMLRITINIIFSPFKWIFSRIINKLLKKLNIFFKKSLYKTKNLLKAPTVLLYNYKIEKNQLRFIERMRTYGCKQKNKEKTDV